jgi:sortase (surface protein transpeptidase)
MKKLMSLMVGLGLVLGTVGMSFAQEAPKTDETKKEQKKKKGSKKKKGEKKEDANKPAPPAA